MLVTARATVEVKVEVPDCLLEMDADLADPGFLYELIKSRRTDKAIAEAFYTAEDLTYACEDVPDRCHPKYLSNEEWFREQLRQFKEGFGYRRQGA